MLRPGHPQALTPPPWSPASPDAPTLVTRKPRRPHPGQAAGAKGGRAYIKRAVTQSLRRLRTDYLDLYQVHTPDPVTPIDETIAALDELVTEGKIRYAGHSNFSGWQLAPAARHFGVGVLPYYPLANGLLTGKVRRGQETPSGAWLAGLPGYITDEKLDRVEALISWAQAQGISLLDVAMGGLAAIDGCSSVIAGAMSPEQVKANAAAGDWVPTAEQRAELDRIVPPPKEDY